MSHFGSRVFYSVLDHEIQKQTLTREALLVQCVDLLRLFDSLPYVAFDCSQ